ncbi:Sec-independent protein translocase subunit TatA/TatB [Moheibacter sediminis]|uniref:Sec-independent protein translocase protein TatA n=1 Tax=Moheibacter sediminis TaxID=1434700 RepID=A0A1W1Z446_9FLAO|nr:twin-arginine translocase TatA/TatE family subunit [Moheibacter sediminis]SMC43153.1 sec-independent protein translocase protein TatA [Moheibacter sediminis]
MMNSLTILPAFISFQELTIILLFAVIIFGPKKIPEIARGLGQGIRAMKEATEDIKREIMNPVDDINPVKDIQDTIEDSKKEVEETIEDALGPVKRK